MNFDLVLNFSNCLEPLAIVQRQFDRVCFFILFMCMSVCVCLCYWYWFAIVHCRHLIQHLWILPLQTQTKVLIKCLYIYLPLCGIWFAFFSSVALSLLCFNCTMHIYTHTLSCDTWQKWNEWSKYTYSREKGRRDETKLQYCGDGMSGKLIWNT